MLDFLDDAQDTDSTPSAEAETPELLEEAQADEDGDLGAQEEPDREEEVQDSEGDDEELEVIEIDGEEVTLDQIKEWKRGTLREQDYTKKTQSLAEERKALEAKLGELNSISDTLTAGETEIKKLLVADLDDIDLKELRESDYPEYLKVKETIKDRESKYEELKQAAAKAKQALIADEQKVVTEMLGWSDSSKREKDVSAYQDFAKDAGFTEKDASSITSAKVMSALIELAHLKKTLKAEPPKAKHKKVKFKSSSVKTEKQAPASLTERLESFF